MRKGRIRSLSDSQKYAPHPVLVLHRVLSLNTDLKEMVDLDRGLRPNYPGFPLVASLCYDEHRDQPDLGSVRALCVITLFSCS